LTAGLHSLDEREHALWKEKIIAGNLYINRPLTGAIVLRQPFGGTKASAFGAGFKTGGPHYLLGLMQLQACPCDGVFSANLPADFQLLAHALPEKEQVLKQAFSSYLHWARIYKQPRDEALVLGQDNFLFGVPHPQITARLQAESEMTSLVLAIGAAKAAQTPFVVSASYDLGLPPLPGVEIKIESQAQFCQRLEQGAITRLRLFSPPAADIAKAASAGFCSLDARPGLEHGQLEVPFALREVSLSCDYHRYGNLGLREGELRAPTL
jgi:RHH-type proline utilization regulon transcriptional repressor/proline dehydrogenase/delta 1-pyrroline-5-carboxylate dehydrogenase